MGKIEWTAEDREIVISKKLKNSRWSWDKIASTIQYRQTPEACRIMFANKYPSLTQNRRYEYKRVRDTSPAWSLTQRRRMAKLRGMNPPVSWKKIANDISKSEHDHHPPRSCQKYYNEIMSDREKKRGFAEAASEAGKQQRDQTYAYGLMRTWVLQRWLPEEEDLLFKLCVDRKVPWDEIANKLKRSIASVQSKWRRLESLHRIESSKKSKGKVVKDKGKKAAGIGKKSPQRKNGVTNGFSPDAATSTA